jgi:hypothetical protein
MPLATGKTMSELSALVRRKLIDLGSPDLPFSIKAMPFEDPNWAIETEKFHLELPVKDQRAIISASAELRRSSFLMRGS